MERIKLLFTQIALSTSGEGGNTYIFHMLKYLIGIVIGVGVLMTFVWVMTGTILGFVNTTASDLLNANVVQFLNQIAE